MTYLPPAILLILCTVALADIPHLNKKQISEKIDSTKIYYGIKSDHLSSALPRAKVLPQDAQNREGTQEEPQERCYPSLQNRTRPPRSIATTSTHRTHTSGSSSLPTQRTEITALAALPQKRFDRLAVAYSWTDHASAGTRPVRRGVFPRLPHVSLPLGSRHNIAFFDRDEAFTDLIDLPEHHH